MADFLKNQFIVPVKAIRTPKDMQSFQTSDTYAQLMQFIQMCSESIAGIEFPSSSSSVDIDPIAIPAIVDLQGFIAQLSSWVDEIPPIKQPMRFGNRAFRNWHARLMVEVPTFLSLYLATYGMSEASVELTPYLCQSFGNETRIDYGTGMFSSCLSIIHLV